MLIISQIIGLGSAPFWLIYNFLSQAYGASLGSVLAIISIITSMIRYRNKDKSCDDGTVGPNGN